MPPVDRSRAENETRNRLKDGCLGNKLRVIPSERRYPEGGDGLQPRLSSR
jgi:hypothetical protein